MKIALTGLLPQELTDTFSLEQSYRGKQLFEWIWRGVTDFEAMSNLPSNIKTMLAEGSMLRSSFVDETSMDRDGTVKIRVKLKDNLVVESVLLTDPDGRKTACLSSQAGCAMGCVFCKTSTMGLRRNLEAHEIAEQYLLLSEGYGEISNIVFMGMGEPLLNIPGMRKAIEVFHHPSGRNIGLRKITVSTCGIVAGIRELAHNGPYTRLALSLPSAIESVRERLMPGAKANPLTGLREALLEYKAKAKQRITIETVLLSGVNDNSENASSIARFVRDIDADVNLIPWNPASGLCFERPGQASIQRFEEALTRAGVRVIRRYQKGDGINGACGQLAVE